MASLGTATDHSSSHSDVSVAATAAVSVNETLIVEVACDNTLGNGVTVADDQGNVYAQDAQAAQTGLPGTNVWLFSAPVTTALSAGDNITVHFTSGLGGVPTAKAVSVLDVDGLAVSSTLDAIQTDHSVSDTPDSGLTSNTSYSDELLIGAIGVGGPNTDTFTPGSGYTLIGRTGANDTSFLASNVTINPEYRTVNAIGQYDADGTLDSVRKWAAAIGTYVIDSGPVITPTLDQSNDEADLVSLQIDATNPFGGTLQYTASGLPDGLSIDSTTGLISGTIAGAAADHSQPFNVDVSASDGATTSHDTFAWTVNNVAPLLTADDVSMTEGLASAVTVGTFTDIGGPEPLGNYAAMIDWGDGTSSTGTIAESAGVFTVHGSHAYAEESASNHTPGGFDHYILSVTVNDDNGITLVSSTATSNAAVSDPAVSATGGYTVSATEGTASSLQTVVTFTDPGGAENVSDYTAMVDWGDGSSSIGTITESAGVFTVQGSHTYAEESAPNHPDSDLYPITVTVSHEDALPDATATSVAHVIDPVVNASGGYTVTATEGVSSGLQTVATFTHAGVLEPTSDFHALIDWGDGTSATPGTITDSGGVYTVQGSHIYAEDAHGPVKVMLSHESAPGVTVDSTANVIDGAIVATGVPVGGYEFSSPTNVAVATFTHADGTEPATNFSATIDWGDGTSSTGTISLSGGVYAVSGSHMYTDENNYTVTVQIEDISGEGGDGSSATATTTAAILEQLLPDDSRGTANQRFISELYRDLLGRQVDAGGLTAWNADLSAGESRTEIAFQITQTTEYINREVERLYQQYLHREADPGGLSYYSSRMQTGATIEQVAAMLAVSDEFFADQGGGTNDGFLNAVYEDASDRPVDPNRLAYYRSHLSAGASREQVVDEILSSQEYRNDVVSQAYEDLLDRSADAAGAAGWVSVLNAGGTDQQVYVGMCGSQEYYDKTLP